MTYLAPRQGLFAIILIVSFILHTLLLVGSNYQQLADINQRTGERIVEQLISESTLALSSKDKVSLSVLAKRYTSEFDIASLVIRGGDDEVLVSLGDSHLSQGAQITGVATLDERMLGELTLSLGPLSVGKIFASLWLYILMSLLVHFFVWLFYGYASRPTKKQLATLSQEVRDHLLKQQPQLTRARRGETAATMAGGKPDNLDSKPSVTDVLKSNVDIGQAVNNYVHEHHDTASQDGIASGIPTEADKSKSQVATSPKPLVATRNMDVVTIQIQFVDKDNLLSTLAPEKSVPYFTLCTQLLEQTITNLKELPLLQGVTFENINGFGTMLAGNSNGVDGIAHTTGATVDLTAQYSNAKIALAAVMLAKLYVMLNRIVYTKHRELQRFALNVKVGISDEALIEPMHQLMSNHADADDILVLLPKVGMKQLNNYIQLRSIKHPTTVYERECAFVIGTNDAMMYRLVSVRNDVLLFGHEDIE